MPIKWLKRIMTSKKEAGALYNQVVNQNKRIRILIDEQKKLADWNTQYVETLSMLTEAIQAMVWKKDADHKYTLANPNHCRGFFGFDGSAECLVYVVGKTDTELIASMFTDRNIENTFAKICILSDEYCMKCTTPVHYLEGGKVDGNQILLYTIKTPQFDSEEVFTGTMGIAWDVTTRSEFLTEQLNRWIYDKLATKLYHDKNSFCYAIVPKLNQCGIFKHVCPHPHIAQETGEGCNLCEDKGGCARNQEVEP